MAFTVARASRMLARPGRTSAGEGLRQVVVRYLQEGRVRMVHPQAADARDTTTTSPLQFRAAGSRPRLTSQEMLVLSLLIQGHHKKTAADVMGISVNTVSFHLKNVYLKLEVHSKTEAVVKALLEGLVYPPGPGTGVER